uniref:Neur_chan_LBD domain-containing protein n=1 Tax=Panagrellus redivivus TaxID=6233 RepID=A0A7E4ZS93_PANRE
MQRLAVSNPENLSHKGMIHLSHNETVYDHDLAVEHFEPGASKRLTEYLLMTHNRHAPPDGIIEVFYEMELVHILGIDELKQTMTALVYIDERWVDHSLVWDPKDFGNLTKTWIPMPKIWRPDMIVFNMLSHEDLLSNVRAPVTVWHNGTIESSNPAVYTVSCEINISLFPLDSQKCALQIASWAYSKEKIRLHAQTEHSLDHYVPNEEWHLLGIDIAEKEYIHEGIKVSRIHYEVAVKRKPLFYMVTLTFPSYVMCATSIVGLFARFSTTGEREERFTLGVSGILTMAVLSLVVSEKVPHSSTDVPLLVAYFLYNMVVVSVASVFTGFVMKVHRKGRFGKEPPEWAMRICLLKPHGQMGGDYKFFPTTKPQSTCSNQLSTHHYVKGSIVRNADPGKLSFEITEDYRRGGKALKSNGNPTSKQPAAAVEAPSVFNKLTDLESMLGQIIQQQQTQNQIRNHSPEPPLSTASGHPGLTSFDAYPHDLASSTPSIKHEADVMELQSEKRRRRMENNGFVKISERLDILFMIVFMVAVTTPVLYLFACMLESP